MIPKFLGLALVASVALLAGCADFGASFTVGPEMAAARTGRGSTPFAEALRREYSTRAQVEYDESHFREARYFAIKAQAATAGQRVLPAEMSYRIIPDNTVATMTQARARLIVALDSGGRDRQPDQAAKAQRGWDCWFEEQEENLQPNDIAACRKDFDDAMAQLTPAPVGAAPAPAPVLGQAPSNFLVFFDFDRSDLSAEARRIIQSAVTAFRSGNRTRIAATGHADRAGRDDYNQRLSERRAASVREELVRLGLTSTQITTLGRGESTPLVPTADGAREPQNRRVELIIN
jgi:OmpA-OmpF porin, OOP family